MSRSRSLALVLAATLATLGLGYVLKAPCLGSWADGRQYNRLCYSDVVALYGSEDRDRGLHERRVPYLEGENEYPVLSGVVMGLASVPARSSVSFFNWNVLLLGAMALGTAALLHRMTGRRAYLFALAPTLAIYAFMSWDMPAVLLATAGTLAYVRGRDGPAGALLGLGAAAKVYPGLLAVPFAGGRLRERRAVGALRIAGWAAVAWAALNVPVALAAPGRWWEFFRFSRERPADWDSVWHLVERHLGFTWPTGLLNVLTLVAFVGAAGLLWWLAARRRPDFPAWSFGFPLLVAFLLTNKVYSPQFSLWLLPWFPLALGHVGLFAAFQVADAAVFVTRFWFFARLTEVGTGVPFAAFEVAVWARVAVLVVCLVAWVRRPAPRLVEPDRVPEAA